tara:strand:+ start:354 stop:617 length:264 start_codon:yes stop_codon:yes gene_type:complete
MTTKGKNGKVTVTKGTVGRPEVVNSRQESQRLVTGYLEGSTLHMAASVAEKGYASSTGKSTIHATTSGFKPVPGSDYMVSLTVIRKK